MPGGKDGQKTCQLKPRDGGEKSGRNQCGQIKEC